MKPWPGLAPLGWLYLAAAGLKNALYDSGAFSAEQVGVPVVGIGNLTTGGTGKTPAAQWLSSRLAQRGFRVGLVSRGYRGRKTRNPLVVSQEGQVLVTAEEAGDEIVASARTPGVWCAVAGRDRIAAARLAISCGATAIVLDDGFQHRRLSRSLDIVLLNAEDPWEGGRGLPAGFLREKPSGIARAGVVLLTRPPANWLGMDHFLDTEQLPLELIRTLERLPAAKRPPCAAAFHRPSAVRFPDGRWEPPETLAHRRVLAVSAIARPKNFSRTLQDCGAIIHDHLVWPDHHTFTTQDASRIASLGREVEWVITTAKDFVRWPSGAPKPLVLEIEMYLPAEVHIMDLVMIAIGSPPR